MSPWNPTTFPTTRTPGEKLQQAHFEKFLKVRAAVFSACAIVFLTLGIFFISFYFKTNKSMLGLGVILAVIGSMCLIISAVILPTLVRDLATRSSSSGYTAKSAEALKKVPYPRQPANRIGGRIASPNTSAQMPELPPSSFHTCLDPLALMTPLLSPSAPPQPPTYDDAMKL